MANPRVPSYRRHSSGNARVTIAGRDYYLGPYGSEESRAAYRRLIAEWAASGHHLTEKSLDLTVEEILAGYFSHPDGAGKYRKNGQPTSQYNRVVAAVRPLRLLYAQTPARSVGPVALQAVREAMVRQGWCRRSVNAHVECVKRVFAWAVAQERIPVSVHQALLTVAGLRKGQTTAHDHPPVRPASDEDVAATIPHLVPMLADVVRLQLLTAARPGEILALRPCELDRRGAVWRLVPQEHKTASHGHRRLILLGPRAQEVLYRWLAVRCPHCSTVGRQTSLAWRGSVAACLAGGRNGLPLCSR